jgi:myo-inositol-1(or 4)-monophosphatase
MSMDHLHLLQRVEELAERAGATLVAMQRGDLVTNRKELRDVVTDADLASEKMILEELTALAPGASIFSEEAGMVGREGETGWIVDPLDGTVNYSAGLPLFCVTIAYQESGSTKVGIVHAPRLGLMARFLEGSVATVNQEPARVSRTRSLSDAVVSVILTSHFTPAESRRAAEIVARLGEVARGVRVIVSGGLEMAMVASAQLDASVSIKADIVSHAAALPLVRAAGGRVTRLDGFDSTDEDLEKISSNGFIHEELLALLQGV